MKIASLMVVIGLGVAAAGCTAEPAAADESESGESEVVGTTSFPALEAAFGLKTGEADRETLRAGDCYRELVLPVEGIPTHHVKKFLNGAIVSPADGKPNDTVCVDLYGDNAMSFSHTMLDAVVRFDLGRFEKKFRDPKTPEGVELHFTKGVMRVFDGIPQAKKYALARATPNQGRVGSAMGIAGSIVDVKLKDVEVFSLLTGARTTMDVPLPAELAGIVHRFAWQHAVKKGAGTMTNDAVGTFTRVVRGGGDAGSLAFHYGLRNGELRYGSSMTADGKGTVESLAIYGNNPPAEGEAPLVKCERTFKTGQLPRPDYACTGL